MHYSIVKGVAFIEGSHPQAAALGPVSVKLDGVFSQAQLKNLDTVKQKMLDEVLRRAGNCVVEFTYGQKSGFWASLLSLDDVAWYGAGAVGRLPDLALQAMIAAKTASGAGR